MTRRPRRPALPTHPVALVTVALAAAVLSLPAFPVPTAVSCLQPTANAGQADSEFGNAASNSGAATRAPAPGPGTPEPARSARRPPVGEPSRPACGAPAAIHRVGGPNQQPAWAAKRKPAEGAFHSLTEEPTGYSTVAVVWRRSRALGLPYRGRLVGGVELPAVGRDYVTVDPVTRTSPNRAWRRYGSDRLVRVLLRVAAAHAAAHPGGPRLVVGDLSRPRGGRFGPEYGGDGHRSHQNGLDADVYYPRKDGRERVPTRVAQIDRRLAQELVDRFVRAGAQFVFVGPGTGLRGPPEVVMVLGNHDDHLHVRIRPDHGTGR